MLDQFSRTELLLGKKAMEKLKNSSIAIFGIGGVGSFAVEALARSGVGSFALFDDDKVCITNINRQLIATKKTIGKSKVEVMRERIFEINPGARVTVYPCFYSEENAEQFPLSSYHYVVDAIDTVSSKLTLIVRAKEAGVPIISCMGAGNKLDPTQFEVADIYKTSMCPLAKVMRRELKVRGVKDLKVVYSKEPAITPIQNDHDSPKSHFICTEGTQRKGTVKRQVPGSVSFVPPVAGLIIAGEVVKDIIYKSEADGANDEKDN